jgi:hypothetical protein
MYLSQPKHIPMKQTSNMPQFCANWTPSSKRYHLYNFHLITVVLAGTQHVCVIESTLSRTTPSPPLRLFLATGQNPGPS